jgi:molybdopterin/thiamine biosynthesis adenylyltransferase
VKTRRYTFHITQSDWNTARASLFTEDGNENAGVFLCGVAATGAGDRLLAREFVSVPFHRYTERKPYHLEVSPQFYDDIITRCIKAGLHPVIVHSHPMAGDAWYSRSDDFGETRLLATLQSLLPDRLVASLVVTWDSATGRRLVDGDFEYLSGMHILGQAVQIIDFDKSKTPRFEVSAKYDRQVRAIGEMHQALLGQLKVAVVGIGGTGSVIAEQLGRVGIGEIILIDNDVVDATNLNRLIGAASSDVGKPKVLVGKEHLETFADADIKAINDSALKQSVLEQIRHVDLVFGCVDNDRTRAALNRFAYQYLIPVIDMGVRLDARVGKVTAAAGRISVVGAGSVCLRCSHHLSSERIRAESLPTDERARLAKEGYVMGAEDAAPSVISINTVIAGLAGTAFLNLFTGLTGGIQPATQIYDATSGSVFPTSQVHEPGCDVCDPLEGVKALGDKQVVSAY